MKESQTECFLLHGNRHSLVFWKTVIAKMHVIHKKELFLSVIQTQTEEIIHPYYEFSLTQFLFFLLY